MIDSDATLVNNPHHDAPQCLEPVSVWGVHCRHERRCCLRARSLHALQASCVPWMTTRTTGRDGVDRIPNNKRIQRRAADSNALTLKLPIVTDSTPELIRWALQGIRVIYRDGYHYKKAGVMFTGRVSASQTQADLFDAQDRGKSKRLMSALDLINDRWGAGTLHYGSSGVTRGWKTQFQRRSPACTTDWNGLPLVQT